MIDQRGESPELLSALPRRSPGRMAKSDRESSYLMSLMQVVETLSQHRRPKAVAALSQDARQQLALPNQPPQRAALARAAVPLLARPGGDTPALVSSVVAKTLFPEQARVGPDAARPTHQAAARRCGKLGGARRRARSCHTQPVLELLDVDWKARSLATGGP